jgi:hypothetical protein
MRALLALPALLLAAGAVLLTGAGALHAGAHHALLASARVTACSSAGDCVKGCAIPVASAPRAPGSPTSPCSKSTPLTICEEYVANPAPSPGRPLCGQSSPTFGERLLSPRLLRQGRKHAEETLRSHERLFRERTRPGAHQRGGR